MIVLIIFHSPVDFIRLIPYRRATRFFHDIVYSVSMTKFTSVSYGVLKPEARSEAWVLFTSVTSSVQHEAML